MESFMKQLKVRVKESRVKNMIESLTSMRTEGDTDVTLVCGDKEFGAHRVILKTSSPYFVNMFSSGMEEAKTGRIEFRSMQPDTLEAVLNYIYLGEVNMICTDQRAIDIFEAARMMELWDLTEVCIVVLCTAITKDNWDTIWDIAYLYENQKLKIAVCEFVVKNFKELRKKGFCLEINVEKWKALLEVAVGKQACLDDLLEGIVDWLRHDFAQREKFTSELFAFIKPKYLTYKRLKAMLQDKTVMTLSTEIAMKMNEIGVALAFFNDDGRLQGTIRFVVPKLSEVITDLHSSPKVIQNVPWNIVISSSVITISKGRIKKNIGCYIQCNLSSEETSWSCYANLVFRLVSDNKDEQPAVVLKRKHLFCSKASKCGYASFICLGDKSDVERRFIVSDPAIFEVEISADAIKGYFY